MDERVDGQLGLVVLHPGLNPTLDIIAVHGLGSNPDRAWVRKVKSPEGAKPEDGEKKVNWLKDLLPAQVPHGRIMAFNYESKRHRDAPKQRRSLCADQLLSAIDNVRKEEKDTKYRPIIFVGHSFGGIVIEQALVIANSRGRELQYLAASTVGIVFLGTPHRGTQTSKWGELMAYSGKALGFGSVDNILKDLREDSETLTDLLYNFTLWLFRESVPAVCFFELHETDCGGRYGFRWKNLVCNFRFYRFLARSDLLDSKVVGERSACIDGHRKVALSTDHFMINKYYGPEDPSLQAVYPVIEGMAENADRKIQARLHPWTIVQDNRDIPQEHIKCLRSLFLTNPPDDLAAIRRQRGHRIDGTCEWLLAQGECRVWLEQDSTQSLWLIGTPGIGKTMVSSFMVEELERKAAKTPEMAFSYYFCDNKHENRRTASAVLRGILLQLLRQRPILFEYIQADYNQMEDRAFESFDVPWRIFLAMLGDPKAGEVYVLIDALDECEKSSRQDLLTSFVKLVELSRINSMANVKLLITTRPDSDILEEIHDVSVCLRIDSGKVNADLSKFIRVEVDNLSRKKRYPPQLKCDVESALISKAEGTFLWVSLVIKDLHGTRKDQVRKKLETLPQTLNEVYDKILTRIEDESIEVAIFVLHWVVIARRPLTVHELAMAWTLRAEHNTIPPKSILDEQAGIFKSCEPIVQLDDRNGTINLVHQSAKDYLLGPYLQAHSSISRYYISSDTANLLVFQTCLRYLGMEEFKQQGTVIIRYISVDTLCTVWLSEEYLDAHCFLRYAVKEWKEHAVAAGPALVTNLDWWKSVSLEKMPAFRDTLLHLAARNGQEAVVELLVGKGANVGARNMFGQAALHLAVFCGHESVARLLIEKGVDFSVRDATGTAAVHAAADGGHGTLVKVLVEKGAGVTLKDSRGRTPLHLAAQIRNEAVVKLLLDNGADVALRDVLGNTALNWAAYKGYEAVVKLLLDSGVDIAAEDKSGETALHSATREGHEAVVKLLLDNGADAAGKNLRGQMVLNMAASNGYEAVVKLLLDSGADVAAKDGLGRTALHSAASEGHEATAKPLLDNGVDVAAKNGLGWTALHLAASEGHKAMVTLLLGSGADAAEKDLGGLTALDLVNPNGSEAVVKLLLENGVDLEATNKSSGEAGAMESLD